MIAQSFIEKFLAVGAEDTGVLTAERTGMGSTRSARLTLVNTSLKAKQKGASLPPFHECPTGHRLFG